ncbi:MAG: hypothetical protein RL328_1723, partial [Acidobacteriota bacterium]
YQEIADQLMAAIARLEPAADADATGANHR